MYYLRITDDFRDKAKEDDGWLASLFSSKKVKPLPAVKDLDLNIVKGEIFGLLGENGAGKTTLMKSIATTILPTSGKIVVNGFDVSREPDKVKRSLGFVSSDGRSFYWRLTGMQNLMFFATLYGLTTTQATRTIGELLEVLGKK